MEIFYPDSNRLGQFLIAHETLRADSSMVGALIALFAVLHIEDHESGRGKVFTVAAKPPMIALDELDDGEEIPQYRVEFAYGRPFENPEWEARRINSGRFGFAFFRKIIVRVPVLAMSVNSRPAALH